MGKSDRSQIMSMVMRKRRKTIEDSRPRPPEDLLEEIAAHVAAGSNVLFVTGAGISVSAGIPAFRTGADAVWTEQIVELGTRKALRRDPVGWYNSFWLPTFECSKIRNARRTAAHEALGAVARVARGVKVVTQNVDGLHVGSIPDPQLIEAHGRSGLFRCGGFGAATGGRSRCPLKVATTEWYEMGELEAEDRAVVERARASDGSEATRGAGFPRCPRCPRCGASLAPLSLLFDENYDAHFFFEAEAWDGWLDDADAIVFAGTSFAVQMTREALRRAKEADIPVFNLNIDEPPDVVANAAMLRRNSVLLACDVSFPRLAALVKAKLRAAGRSAPPPRKPRRDDDEEEEEDEDEEEASARVSPSPPVVTTSDDAASATSSS